MKTQKEEIEKQVKDKQSGNRENKFEAPKNKNNNKGRTVQILIVCNRLGGRNAFRVLQKETQDKKEENREKENPTATKDTQEEKGKKSDNGKKVENNVNNGAEKNETVMKE